MSASNNFITKPVLSTVCSLSITVVVGWVFIHSNQKATQRGGFGMSGVLDPDQVITVG